MINITNVTLSYRNTTLIHNLTCALEPGHIYGLVAPNGRGKTTLLRSVAALGSAHMTGEISVDNLAPQSAAYHRQVFYAPGDASLLYPYLTARTHLKMVRDLWRSDIQQEELISTCNLEGFGHKKVRVYSQGMKQQLTLAIAYATQARYLLLDEPMNALDPSNGQRQTKLIMQAARRGQCVVMSSHLLEHVDKVCDKIWFLKDHRILELGKDIQAPSAQAAYQQLFVDE